MNSWLAFFLGIPLGMILGFFIIYIGLRLAFEVNKSSYAIDNYMKKVPKNENQIPDFMPEEDL